MLCTEEPHMYFGTASTDREKLSYRTASASTMKRDTMVDSNPLNLTQMDMEHRIKC